MEIRAGTRSRDCIATGNRAARVQATANTSIPIFYAKWNGPPGKFARCMRTNERSYLATSSERSSTRERERERERKVNVSREEVQINRKFFRQSVLRQPRFRKWALIYSNTPYWSHHEIGGLGFILSSSNVRNYQGQFNCQFWTVMWKRTNSWFLVEVL